MTTSTPMPCTDARQLLPAYGDGQLDLAHALEVEAHIAGCAACTQALSAQRELGRALRERLPQQRMPEALRERLRASLPQTPAQPGAPVAMKPQFRRRREWLQWAAPLAAALVVAVGVNGLLIDQRASAGLRDEVVSGHVRSLLAAHLDDVISTDQHTVKPWFNGKLDYAPPVHDFAAQGYALAGGRLDYIAGRNVAALDYRHRKHVINLYVWPGPQGSPSALKAETRDGYNIAHWTAQGMVWWAVSDLNAEELHGFTELLRAPLPPPSPPAPG